MKQSLVMLSVLAILTSSLAGCSPAKPASDSPSTSQKTTTAATSTAASSEKDLCVLMSTADIGGILGYTVESDRGRMPQNETSTSCRYTNAETGHGVSIIANYDNKYGTAASTYKATEDFQLKDTANTAHPELNNVVGEKSFGWSTGSMTQFNALKGKVWITLSLFGGDETARLGQAKAIGEKALSVL